MSLINQMLRDLDARRGPASSVETAVLQGMGLDAHADDRQRMVLHRAGWALGLILAGILLQQGYHFWSERRANPVLTTAPALMHPVTSPPLSAPTQPPPVVSALTQITDTPPAPNQVQVHAGTDEQTTEAHPVDTYTSPAPAEAVAKSPIKHAPSQTAKVSLSPEQKARRRFDRAQTLLASDRTRAAANELWNALEVDPKLSEARLQLATLYLHRGRTGRARQLLEAGYQIDPGNAEISTAYARLLAELGEYQRALELLDISKQQGPVDAETLALAAGVEYRIKRYSSSASHYRDALSRHPGRGVWWMGLGVSLEHNQQPTEALAAYHRASNTSLDAALLNFVTGRITALSGRTD